MDFSFLEKDAAALKGRIGVYYQNLSGPETFCFHADEEYRSASMVKLAILIEAFRQMDAGMISRDDILTVRDADRVPSCGAMAYLHTGARLTVLDVCRLMIVISDNMAANVMADYLKFENINTTLQKLGFEKTRMKRHFYETDPGAKQLKNTFSPLEFGRMLLLLWEGRLVSPKASEEMLGILKWQQINYKIPSLLPEDLPIAHKTGEDTGITHDGGIIYAKRPFIFCVASNDTDVVETEEFIRRAAFRLYTLQNT